MAQQPLLLKAAVGARGTSQINQLAKSLREYLQHNTLLSLNKKLVKHPLIPLLVLATLIAFYAVSCIDSLAQQQYLTMKEARRHRQELAAEKLRSNLKAV
jgi:hypothetical protein